MKKITAFIITAGHLDIEWYQPMLSYRFWTTDALESLRDQAAPRADFHSYVLDGQVFPLEEYLDVMPEAEGTMRQLIRDGKLCIGPFYTQFDEWLPSAENMIRNCLYGRRKAEAFGGYMRAGYLPDNFGHPLQMPQILRGFGIDSLMFMRGMPEIPGGHPDEFIYQGLDGSTVLVSHFRESYSGAFDIFDKDIDPIAPREVPYYKDYLSFEWHKELADHDDPQRIAKAMVENVHRIKQRYPSGIIPLISGFDHLPPQINIGDSAKAANEMQDEIEFVMGNVEDYVLAAQANLREPALYDMELIGSMYQYVLLGALSTRTYLKQQNFGCEALLERYAEPLDAIAQRYGCPDRPRLLDEAWRYLLINSAHDSIHGSSVDETHIDMQSRFGGARQIASGVIHDAMAHIGAHQKHWWHKGERALLTYAPVGASYPQMAELWLPVGDSQIEIVDASGRRLKTQILAREPIALNGIGMERNDPFPANVYRKVLFLDTFKSGELKAFAAREADQQGEALTASNHTLENEFLVVQVQGALIHITDKLSGYTHHSLNLLEEDADAGDAWDYAAPWTPGEIVRSTGAKFASRLIECGAVRASIELTGELSVPAQLIGDQRSAERVPLKICFLITLQSGARRVDVKLTLDNQARDHRIRLRIPTGLRARSVLSQGHLAILDRPIERQKEIEPWRQPPTQLLPCREWVAAQDDTHGLAVALKGLYDYEAVMDPLTNQPDVFVTLLRGFELMGRRNTKQRFGSASEAFVTPGAQCLGQQVFEWAFAPYEVQPEEKAPFLPAVQGFLYPPVAHALRAEAGEEMELPAPLFAFGAPNVQFSAFKKCLSRDGYVLRMYENQGKQTQIEIDAMGYTQAWLADMNEQAISELPIESGRIALTFGPYKALTVKLK